MEGGPSTVEDPPARVTGKDLPKFDQSGSSDSFVIAERFMFHDCMSGETRDDGVPMTRYLNI